MGLMRFLTLWRIESRYVGQVKLEVVSAGKNFRREANLWDERLTWQPDSCGLICD